MKCRRVEKLIPLFVESDLPFRLSERVASHLEWCGRCNWLADEYEESQTWLRSGEPPNIDESGIFKRSVLTQVANLHRSPSFWSLFQHRSRRQVFALSGGLLVMLGVLVFYVYHARINFAPRVKEIVEQKPDGDVQDQTGPTLTEGTKQAPGVTFDGQRRISRKRLHPASSRHNSMIAVRAMRDKLIAQPPAAIVKTIFPDPSGTLRIEIQTSDPSIRIIWFAPKGTDPHQNKPVTD